MFFNEVFIYDTGSSIRAWIFNVDDDDDEDIEVILFDLLLYSLVCALVLLNMVNFKTLDLISSMDKDMAHIYSGKNMGFSLINNELKALVVSLFRYIDKIRAISPIHGVQKCGH